MNVLIVEDQVWFLEQLTQLVRDIPGACIVGAVDTADGAIAAIQAEQPDVVLLDLMLREGTGFDVLRRVRQHAPKTKFFVVTSFPTLGIKKVCLIGGADGFFDKLLELDAIRTTLATLANQPKRIEP
jgi:DNA-binding NarL/FixJ family response regulator